MAKRDRALSLSRFHRLISVNFAWKNVPTGGVPLLHLGGWGGASPASAVQNYLYDRGPCMCGQLWRGTISMSLVGVQALTAFPAELAKPGALEGASFEGWPGWMQEPRAC